jgi:hypothetical protein
MSVFNKIWNLYYDGFRNMREGKTLWIIIFIKLFVMFAVLRLFLFHDFLGSKFSSDRERSDYVIEQLTTKPK